MTILDDGVTTVDTSRLYLRVGTSEAGELVIDDNGSMRPATDEEVDLALNRVAHLRSVRRQARRIAH